MQENRIVSIMKQQLGLCLLLIVTIYQTAGAADVKVSTEGQLSAKDYADSVANTIAEWLPSRLAGRQVPGAAAVVVNREGVTWRGTWGVTGGKPAKAIDEDTLFNIRSISKSVTALGVLMAVQEGLVDLDAPISTYLPEFRVHSLYDLSLIHI